MKLYLTNIETIREFAAQVTNMEGVEIGEPIILDEISFVPLIKHPALAKEERDYLTLSEALEEGVCKIFDKGTEVSHITFQNLSDLPILIEEGEIFKGAGTQDRICIATVKVDPGAQVDISVKCVHAPHHLSSGAAFGYGGKGSRGMLNQIRAMKYGHAQKKAPASTINQNQVWNKVSEEMAEVSSASDQTKYTIGVEARRVKAKKRSSSLKFPKNTIGIVVINPKGEIKGVEVHRSPHNFAVRKDGILESLEPNISWKPIGKGPFKDAKGKTKELFKKLSKIEEGKDALKQVEVDGLVINSEGISGEAFTTTFYSGACPSCNKPKPRKKACPHCGFLEADSEELAYMSLL